MNEELLVHFEHIHDINLVNLFSERKAGLIVIERNFTHYTICQKSVLFIMSLKITIKK